jgi:hypothetical protein
MTQQEGSWRNGRTAKQLSLTGTCGYLSGDAGEHDHRRQNDFWFRPEDFKRCSFKGRWPASARESFALAPPSRDAAILARLEPIERWARSEPHRLWWQAFLGDSGGTGFWHETYVWGVEVGEVDMQTPNGTTGFAPVVPARRDVFCTETVGNGK